VNPLRSIKSGALRAWRGTARTAKWAGSGVVAGPKRAAGAITGATRDARERIRDGAEGALDRTGGTRALERARSNRWVAIAWITGAILFVAWIGWAIYSTAEYGGMAGLGVLISWPAVIAALALVAAPFVGLYLLVQRLREPAIAGINGGGGADAPGTAEVGAREETENEAADEDESEEGQSDEGDEPEADDESDGEDESDED
jgi:hypothetical protein